MFNKFSLILCIVLLASCKRETVVTEIISTHVNGNPMVVHYYKYNGNEKYKAIEVRLLPNGTDDTRTEFNAAGKKHGKCFSNFENGNPRLEETYENGFKQGKVKIWYENGELEYKGNFDNGLPHGTWTFYSPEGKKLKKVTYDKGKEIEKTEY